MDHLLLVSPPGVTDNPESFGQIQEMLAKACPPVISHLTMKGSPSYTTGESLVMVGPAPGGSGGEDIS